MAEKSPAAAVVSPAERLSIRVSNMINAPKAQIDRRAVIHKLDTDPERVWLGMVEALSEIDELALIHNDDGTITVEWGPQAREDDEEVEEEVLMRVAKLGA